MVGSHVVISFHMTYQFWFEGGQYLPPLQQGEVQRPEERLAADLPVHALRHAQPLAGVLLQQLQG